MFQESLPPSNSREESQERRRKRSSRESDSRERLTERCAENAALELSSSIADCCCIGPRSRLPLPRIPPSASNTATTYPTSSSSTCGTGGGGVVGGAGGGVGGIAGGPVPFPGPPTSSNSRVAGVEQPATLTTPTTSAQPTLVNSNNNRGMLQTSVGNSTGQHHQAQSSAALTAAVPSSSTSFNTSTAVPTLQSVSVPRQLAQWTKHQTLKLQVFVYLERSTQSTMIDRSNLLSYNFYDLPRNRFLYIIFFFLYFRHRPRENTESWIVDYIDTDVYALAG